MLNRVLVVILLMSISFSTAVQGEPLHWAGKEITDVQARGIEVADHDSPANPELQEILFRTACLSLQPTANLTRYQLVSFLVEELQLPDLEEQELALILKDYLDTCDY